MTSSGLIDKPNFQGFLFDPINEQPNENPSGDHWLGTDSVSRDILSRLVWGGRVSLTVALVSVTLGMVVGGLVGITVGYVRGKTEAITMSVIDIILAFPALVILLGLVAFLEDQNLRVIATVIGFLSIPPYARVARANTLTIAEREYVRAAQVLGAKKSRILFREVLPNVVPPLAAFALVAAGIVIVLEGSLAFLGLSVERPTATWGSMIALGRQDLKIRLHPVLFPSMVMFFTVLSLNFVGDWLRKRLNVRESGL